MSGDNCNLPGKVFLVGAGPGDPKLLTVRAVSCLGRADVVLYDYLVNPRILSAARADAEFICLGRHHRSRTWTPSEICRQLVAFAQSGKTVVRLKNGDPSVFARGGEEMAALTAARIPFEVVPGITAGLAAGSCAGIPVTHRQLASAVALVTGHERDQKEEITALDYESLARFPGTLIFYMGVSAAPVWTASLIASGKSPETPAAIVRNCSLPDQQTTHCRLDEVASRMQERKIVAPVVVIVGPVAAEQWAASWFERRPLFGKRILITRAAEQAGTLAEQLEELGADVLCQPAIEIGPPSDWAPVDRALERIADFDWLVFSSSNGVRYLLDRLLSTGRDLRQLGGVRLAVIGPGTADELLRYHLKSDLQPQTFRAESLAAALIPEARGKRFLLARASRGREVLAEELQKAGGIVDQVVVYRSTDCRVPEPRIAEALASGRLDYVTVTSSAIAKSIHALFGQQLASTRLVSISPITSQTLRDLGLQTAAEAGEYTMRGVVEAILRDVNADRSAGMPGQAAS
jgi:uroporphyrinogen III methyltransferase/synthase